MRKLIVQPEWVDVVLQHAHMVQFVICKYLQLKNKFQPFYKPRKIKVMSSWLPFLSWDHLLMSANLIKLALAQFQSNRFVQISEIDEYREMYHLFDKALFLMPPKHWLRSFCKTILSSQLADPQSNPSFRPRPVQLRMIVKNRVRYIFRWVSGQE